jgi:hypothetical protein
MGLELRGDDRLRLLGAKGAIKWTRLSRRKRVGAAHHAPGSEYFSRLAREPSGGLVVMPDSFTLAYRVEI